MVLGTCASYTEANSSHSWPPVWPADWCLASPSCLTVTGEIIGSLSWTHQWRRKWQPTPVFLPGKLHGQRSLEGYRPRGHKVWATTEHTPMHKRPEASLGGSRQGFQLCGNHTSVSDKEFKSPIYKNHGVTQYLSSRELTSWFPFPGHSFFKERRNGRGWGGRTETGKYCFQWLYLKMLYEITLFDVGRAR